MTDVAELLDVRSIVLDLDVEIRAVADVQYRCMSCKGLMAPKDSVMADGAAWHPEHAPEGVG